MIRHLLAEVWAGRLCAQAAARELNGHPSRLYQLRTDYLRAYAQGSVALWVPGTSGGDHHPAWPAEAQALLRRLLSSDPPCSYSAAPARCRPG